jgi:hypothetical protein
MCSTYGPLPSLHPGDAPHEAVVVAQSANGGRCKATYAIGIEPRSERPVFRGNIALGAQQAAAAGSTRAVSRGRQPATDGPLAEPSSLYPFRRAYLLTDAKASSAPFCGSVPFPRGGLTASCADATYGWVQNTVQWSYTGTCAMFWAATTSSRRTKLFDKASYYDFLYGGNCNGAFSGSGKHWISSGFSGNLGCQDHVAIWWNAYRNTITGDPNGGLSPYPNDRWCATGPPQSWNWGQFTQTFYGYY